MKVTNSLGSFAADTTRHTQISCDQRPRRIRGGDICQRCELDHFAQIQTVSRPPRSHGAEVRIHYFDSGTGLVGNEEVRQLRYLYPSDTAPRLFSRSSFRTVASSATFRRRCPRRGKRSCRPTSTVSSGTARPYRDATTSELMQHNNIVHVVQVYHGKLRTVGQG